MNWEWKYEDQGYVLETGECYLPDFELRLPNEEEWYIEVKPDNFDKFDQNSYMDKLQCFTKEVGKDLLIVDGNPSCKPFDVACHKFHGFEDRSLALAFLQDYEPYIRWVDAYWMGYINFNETAGRSFSGLVNDERMQRKSFGRKYVDALKAVREEKFGI
jgi:hypothetical protein